MPFPSYPDLLIAFAAIAAAVSVRPWRLLAFASRYELLAPLLLLGVALPLMWWSPNETAGPIMGMMGAQLALLTLGWPLAVLLFTAVGLASIVGVDASLADAVGTLVWAGVVPATLGLAAGHAVRVWGGANPLSYLMGRAFLVALAATFAAALLAQWLSGRYDSLGHGLTAALFFVSLLDAMVTGACMTLLIVRYPLCVATWSDSLYFGDEQAHTKGFHAGARPPDSDHDRAR